MSRYQPLTIEGKAYDLSHLDSFSFKFVVPEKDARPAQVYAIEIEFDWHCFTRKIAVGEKVSEGFITIMVARLAFSTSAGIACQKDCLT